MTYEILYFPSRKNYITWIWFSWVWCNFETNQDSWFGSMNHIDGKDGCSAQFMSVISQMLVTDTLHFKVTNIIILPTFFYCHQHNWYCIIEQCHVRNECLRRIRWLMTSCKLGIVVRMVVDTILPHVESGPNDRRTIVTITRLDVSHR